MLNYQRVHGRVWNLGPTSYSLVIYDIPCGEIAKGCTQCTDVLLAENIHISTCALFCGVSCIVFLQRFRYVSQDFYDSLLFSTAFPQLFWRFPVSVFPGHSPTSRLGPAPPREASLGPRWGSGEAMGGALKCVGLNSSALKNPFLST